MDNILISEYSCRLCNTFSFPHECNTVSKMLEPHYKENRQLHPSRDMWSEEVCVNKKVKTRDKFKIKAKNNP